MYAMAGAIFWLIETGRKSLSHKYRLDSCVEYLIVAVVSVVAVEVFLKLPVKEVTGDLISVAKRASRTVLSPHISDHWKEKVMLAYARKTFTNTLKLAAILLIFLFLTLSPVFIVDFLEVTDRPVLSLLATTKGLVTSTAAAASYFWLRGRFAK